MGANDLWMVFVVHDFYCRQIMMKFMKAVQNTELNPFPHTKNLQQTTMKTWTQ